MLSPKSQITISFGSGVWRVQKAGESVFPGQVKCLFNLHWSFCFNLMPFSKKVTFPWYYMVLHKCYIIEAVSTKLRKWVLCKQKQTLNKSKFIMASKISLMQSRKLPTSNFLIFSAKTSQLNQFRHKSFIKCISFTYSVNCVSWIYFFYAVSSLTSIW